MLDATDGPATAKDFMWMHSQLNQNFGTQYPADKILQLRQKIEAKRWSGKRLRETTEAFLARQKFPAWTIADFMEAGSMKTLKPWIPGQVHSAGAIDLYKIQDRYFFKPTDGEELPFEKVTVKPSVIQPLPVTNDAPVSPERAKEIAESILGKNAMSLLAASGIGSDAT